jgi:hypothetical protein
MIILNQEGLELVGSTCRLNVHKQVQKISRRHTTMCLYITITTSEGQLMLPYVIKDCHHKIRKTVFCPFKFNEILKMA